MSVEQLPPSDAIATLRQELKVWEKAFAASNGGRKAGRDDIKTDALIAAKYREYDRLRRPASRETQRTPRKSTSSHSTAQSPSTRAAPYPAPAAATPRKASERQAHQFVAPSPAREPSPTPQAIRMRLGPTPQKDGQILSLFDCLSSGGPTPSKSRARDPLNDLALNIAATPSKSRQLSTIAQSPAGDDRRLSRTPASSGKRFMLDAFATPIKRKRTDDALDSPSCATGAMATPAFLRRSNIDFANGLDVLAERGEGLVDDGLREPPFKKRGLVRSLSAIIQGLRKQVEDEADEELDMLRELEMEAEGGMLDARRRVARVEPATVLVEDSQVAMPLGPDRNVGSDSEAESSDEEGLNAQGKPRKVWKKKGLKRQTKRVIMRPVNHKPKAIEQPQGENDAVQETQIQGNAMQDLGEGSDDEAFEPDGTVQEDGEKVVKQGGGAVGTTIVKAARKIKASAHANFRKLKIKNQNSKAKGRGKFSKR